MQSWILTSSQISGQQAEDPGELMVWFQSEGQQA